MRPKPAPRGAAAEQIDVLLVLIIFNRDAFEDEVAHRRYIITAIPWQCACHWDGGIEAMVPLRRDGPPGMIICDATRDAGDDNKKRGPGSAEKRIHFRDYLFPLSALFKISRSVPRRIWRMSSIVSFTTKYAP